MAENSRIEWTEHTFSPWWGCTKVSDGCAHCYAERYAKKWGFDCWGSGKERRRLSEATWYNPQKWDAKAQIAEKMARVFPSMCDVFDKEGIYAERNSFWRLIENTPWLLWMLLTKRPENITEMIPVKWWENPPKNVWYGVTVEDNRYRHRIDELFKVPAAGYFISYEPALGPLDLDRYFGLKPGNEWLPCLCDEIDPKDRPCIVCNARKELGKKSNIKLVITGGESGPEARQMDPDWARDVRDQCIKAGVPFLFKQWGEWAPVLNADGTLMCHSRVGKRRAGRILNGRTWDGETE